MFDVLLESHATRPRRPRSTMASALTHGAIIAAAIVLSRPHPGRAVSAPDPLPVIYVPVQTETRVDQSLDHHSRGAGPGTERATVKAPNFTGTQLPQIDLVLAATQATDLQAAPDDGFEVSGSVVGPGPRHPDGILDEHLVDRIPRVIGRAPEPRYPSALRDAGVQGRVVAEFVVDTLGRAEMDGLKLDAAHPLLGESVRAVLPRYRFTPGEAGGGKVRTRVQLPFDFALTR
jgi:protein TonB